MKKLLALLAGGTVAAGSLAVPALAGGGSVAVRDNEFSPKAKTVSKGQKVTWVWRGDTYHNVAKVKGPGGGFRSPTQKKGRYVHRFTRKGTYKLVCTIHTGMDMKVVVR